MFDSARSILKGQTEAPSPMQLLRYDPHSCAGSVGPKKWVGEVNLHGKSSACTCRMPCLQRRLTSLPKVYIVPFG